MAGKQVEIVPLAALQGRFAAYIRREAMVAWASWGLAAGLGVALLLAAAAWAFPILRSGPRAALSVAAIASSALIASLVAALRRRPAIEIARQSDARMHLRERLATAVEIQAGVLDIPPQIAARQLADALAAAGHADPDSAFALRFPRRQALYVLPLLALWIASLALPNPQEMRLAAIQAEQAALAAQIAQLEEVRNTIAADPGLSEADREALLQELDDTLGDLQEGSLSPEQAVARLSEAENKLRALAQASAAERPAAEMAQALQDAGTAAGRDPSTEALSQALTEGRSADAAQALEVLAAKVATGELGETDRQSTAQRLEEMAGRLDALPELAQALREAAQALREGDDAAASSALQRAAALTEQAGQAIAAQQAAEQALGQIQESKRAIAQAGGGTAEEEPAGTLGGSGSGHGTPAPQGEPGTPAAPQGPIVPGQPGQGGTASYEPLYVPERLGGTEGETVTLPGQGAGGQGAGETAGHTPGEEVALVPYDQVYADYRAQAIGALENSYIPRGVKEYVRAYFSSLEPQE
jgi:hypothetical protein